MTSSSVIACICGKVVFASALTTHYLFSSNHPTCASCQSGFRDEAVLAEHVKEHNQSKGTSLGWQSPEAGTSEPRSPSTSQDIAAPSPMPCKSAQPTVQALTASIDTLSTATHLASPAATSSTSTFPNPHDPHSGMLTSAAASPASAALPPQGPHVRYADMLMDSPASGRREIRLAHQSPAPLTPRSIHSEVLSMSSGWKPHPATHERTVPLSPPRPQDRMIPPSLPHRHIVSPPLARERIVPPSTTHATCWPSPAPTPMPTSAPEWRVSHIFCRACRRDPCHDAATTLCGHIFCHRCIASAALHIGRCPACEAPVMLTSVFRLHVF
ncbi:hypothetical protein K488DRAFT_81360 [Vararia minispora EC-137]|uniref:Uncharacterized protein n=1 Tax=Vararia minispora EC-137 TaxID=1314806 RepID=A0ACB8QZD4_9AGAM|nr:hypothetical protein K488DRAFT_81360 [Vararia minispora EC-137]